MAILARNVFGALRKRLRRAAVQGGADLQSIERTALTSNGAYGYGGLGKHWESGPVWIMILSRTLPDPQRHVDAATTLLAVGRSFVPAQEPFTVG